MNAWPGRLGAALALSVIGGFVLWVLMAFVLLLANYLPVWVMWALIGGVFVSAVVFDWFVDMTNAQRRRDRYEIARRAAEARGDDEL